MGRRLSLIAKGIRDVHTPKYPVAAGSHPDASGPYPLDLRPASASFHLDGEGVVVAASRDGAAYRNPVSVSLYALARHTEACGTGDNSVAGAGRFLVQARHLRQSQDSNGGWQYLVPVTRYGVAPGWYSAMAQGLAVSVMLRAYDMTGKQSYLDAATAAVTLLLAPLSEGGCADYDATGRPFLEECPSQPPCHILNGAVFALIGLAEREHRVGGSACAVATERLAAHLQDYDTGYWSRYDLRFPAPATLAYHSLHISLLTAAERLFPGHGFGGKAACWRSYLRSPTCRLRAAAGKARFAMLGEDHG
jgi:heparosan-N-sulfate-glucuronate 5-epimerase